MSARPAAADHPGPPAAQRWWTAMASRAEEPLHGATGPRPPTAAELDDRMDLLDVPAEDRGAVAATMPAPDRHPLGWRALLGGLADLYPPGGDPFERGVEPAAPDWPDAPPETGAAGRFFYVHLYLLAVPEALRRQRARGVDAEVVAATFADLGAKLRAYRRTHGAGGFDRQLWLTRHFRGDLHRLGRLQFERGFLDASACGGGAGDAGGPGDGDAVLRVHIPGDGPLAASAVAAALSAARPFYGRHFTAPDRARADRPATGAPGWSARWSGHATCHSWLLDPGLAEVLEPGANILAFQSAFRPFGDLPAADADVRTFVFEAAPGVPTADLPRDTTLRRALIARWEDGGHWRLGHGWTALRGPAAVPCADDVGRARGG